MGSTKARRSSAAATKPSIASWKKGNGLRWTITRRRCWPVTASEAKYRISNSKHQKRFQASKSKIKDRSIPSLIGVYCCDVDSSSEHFQALPDGRRDDSRLTRRLTRD